MKIEELEKVCLAIGVARPAPQYSDGLYNEWHKAQVKLSKTVASHLPLLVELAKTARDMPHESFCEHWTDADMCDCICSDILAAVKSIEEA